jgi:hypothetical protein
VSKFTTFSDNHEIKEGAIAMKDLTHLGFLLFMASDSMTPYGISSIL